jgi:DNA invertase Pin-like site-specific DNA recombinase
LERLERKNVSLRVLCGNLDTATPEGRTTKSLLAPLAQFDQELRHVRRREEIAKAKAEARYRGRGFTARSQAAAIILLKQSGKPTSSIAQGLGITLLIMTPVDNDICFVEVSERPEPKFADPYTREKRRRFANRGRSIMTFHLRTVLSG